MLQNPNFAGLRPGPARGILQRSPTDGEGLVVPAKNSIAAVFGPRFYGSQVQPITKLAILLMTDFKCRPIRSSYFLVSETEKMDS